MFIVKVPGVNGNEKAKLAGNAILKELKNIELNSQGKEVEFAKIDLEEIHLDDANLKLTNKLIYENAFESYENNPRVIFLGGDGSVSYSLSRAFLDFADSSGKEPCLIVFDSKLDCLRIAEFASNRNWLRKVVEEGFNPKSILIVGARELGKEEFNFVKNNGIRLVPLDKIMLTLEDSCDSIMEFSSGKELYVSFDLNALDSKNKGGISDREIIYLVSRINKMKNLRSFDITEVDVQKEEVRIAARIVSELV